MPLGTLDRTPPPFFKQGPSALSKLMFFSALALFLMVADMRFRVTQPIRAVLATALYPVQWAALQPVRAFQNGGSYFTSLNQAKNNEEEARRKLATLSVRAGQVEQLAMENNRLRKLLELREQKAITGLAAEVLYDAPDPYTRKIIIDKGLTHGVELASPVVDESGVLGQVTRVHPFVSEVTLVIDRELAIPVLNTRTGARSVAYGEPTASGGGLELRFMGSNSDVQQGDLLTTSGVDGVYPAGLPVAKIDKIERRAESAFARIYCVPQAQVAAALHVMVIRPVSSGLPPRPADEPPPGPPKKGGGK
ncbi:MAG: rod shape-determining protein MreC [Polaromonas sp.]|nr:rod shape-determining protein MreC [Polaromonas sp.]